MYHNNLLITAVQYTRQISLFGPLFDTNESSKLQAQIVSFLYITYSMSWTHIKPLQMLLFYNKASWNQNVDFICTPFQRRKLPFVFPWIRFHCVCFPHKWWNQPINKKSRSHNITILLCFLLLRMLKTITANISDTLSHSNKLFLIRNQKPKVCLEMTNLTHPMPLLSCWPCSDIKRRLLPSSDKWREGKDFKPLFDCDLEEL